MTGTGTNSGLNALSGTGAFGNGISATGQSTNGHGMNLQGSGASNGLKATGGATGNGMRLVGGGTSGSGLLVDTTSGEETLLVVIPPGKLNSDYHRYRVPDADWGDTIECLCKRAYVPAVADNDPISPGNLGALKLGMMALQFEDRNDSANAAKFWGPNEPENHPGAFWGAIDLLNAELNQFQGDAVTPAIQFAPSFGAGPIPAIF